MAKDAAAVPMNLPRGRVWLFRVLALGLPVSVLALLELILRLSGYGHPTTFFVPRQIHGQDVLVDNAWFGLRFFPPTLARSPNPAVMRAQKPPGVYRIFLFGESAALGDPRPSYGVGRYLESLLRKRFPGTEFEVVCVAMTAINSHAVLPIAHECAHYQGDLWIVYMGNNEFVGPFGASTIFGLQAPPRVTVRLYLALQKSRLGQWVADLARRIGRGASSPTSWGGMKMFLDQQNPPDDPRKERVYDSFRRNLVGILQAGTQAGVPVIVSSVASNLKDCPPFGSLHFPSLDGSRLAEWQRLYQGGAIHAEQARFANAVSNYQQAVQLSPAHAELCFRLGQCFLSLTNLEAARASFGSARDLDALPFRADARINTITADAVRRYAGKGVVFLDAEQSLAPASPCRIPGEESFYEHVHLNPEGNYQLARALAEKTLACLPARVTHHQNSTWAEPEVCARDLALTDWNRLAVLEEVARRLSDAPFTNQFDQAIRFQRLQDRLAACKGRLQPQALKAARAIYDEALKNRPNDHWLHHNYAEFLTAIGDLSQAIAQMQIVSDLIPYHHASYFQTGRLLARQRRFEEARQSFQAALSLRPDFAEAYVELGQTLANMGKPEEALTQYANALHYHPGEPSVYLLRAQALERQKHRPEAIQSLREALRLRPSFCEAHDLLGIELGLEERFPEAALEFEEVVRLRPNQAEGHLNLGIALARSDRLDEALTHFEITQRLEPHNERAREFIEAIRQRKAVGAPQ